MRVVGGAGGGGRPCEERGGAWQAHDHGRKECLRQKEQDKQLGITHRERTQKERSVYSLEFQKVDDSWF